MLLTFSSRKKEVLLTVATNLVLQVVNAVCGFILPPLVIGTFGSSVNGMVSSITQFIAYLNIVEAGVGGASIAALYKPLALGDTTERNAILSATAKFYNRSGLLFTILIFVLALVYPLLVGNEVDRMQSFLMVLVLGITGAAEFFLIGKYRVLLTADKKVYVISLVQMLALIFSTVLAVILIKSSQGIVIVKLFSSFAYLLRYLFLSLYVRRHYRNVDFRAESNYQAISQSRNVLIHQICGLVVFNSPLIFITVFCSLKDASVYAVYAMVFNAVTLLLGSFSNGMQSFLGESLVRESVEATRRIFSKYETYFLLINGWFYAMTYLLIIPFMRIYTKSMVDAEYIQFDLALLFICVGFLTNMRSPHIQLISAAGHFKKTQWRSLLEAAINITFSAFGVLLFGFKGVLIGAISSSIYRDLDSIIYVATRLLHSSRMIVYSLLKNLLFIILYIVLDYYFRKIPYIPVSYMQWGLMGVFYTVAFGFLFAGFILLKYLFKSFFIKSGNKNVTIENKIDNSDTLVTIFTPAYNRAYILKRLYDSLLNQTSYNFEWIIVDDGSTDNTQELCKSFITKLFTIKYIKQENGGKHRAINNGVKLAAGDLFFIVDSDDFLCENAIEKILFYWKKRKSDCLGLCFRRIDYVTNEVIGWEFPKHEFYASSIQMQFKYNLNFDKAEIFRTDILKKYPFPEIDGEKFCTEGVCWLRMAKGKIDQLYCIDEAIYKGRYLEDGLTANYEKIMEKNPKGYFLYYSLFFTIPYFYLHPKLVLKTLYWLIKNYKTIKKRKN